MSWLAYWGLLVFFVPPNFPLSSNKTEMKFSPVQRTPVKLAVVVPLEQRNTENLVQQAIDMFNAKSRVFVIEPIFALTSNQDSLLRYVSSRIFLNNFLLSLKSVCQVVEEEIVGVLSLSVEDWLSSLCYTLGIPLLVLQSERARQDTALSSLINLQPVSEMVGKALTDVIRTKSRINSVMVYKNENDFLLLKDLIQRMDHFNGGFKLLEITNSSTLAEKLSLGSVHCIKSCGETKLKRCYCFCQFSLILIPFN